jgi:hypothetical protein
VEKFGLIKSLKVIKISRIRTLFNLGVTLDIGNSKIFNHEELKRRVMRKIDGKEDLPMELDNRRFKISIEGEIHTVHSKKKFQINLLKGVLIGDGQLVPFGYSGELMDPRNDEYYRQSDYHYKRRDELEKILVNRFHPANPLNFILQSNDYYAFLLKKIFHL